MAEKPPKILSVVPAGTPQAQRYRISDQFMRYWTGHGWSEPEAEHDGLLYASSHEACHEVQRLLKLEYNGLPCRRFRAPVYVDLYCPRDIPKDKLIRWLLRASKLIMNSDDHGNGPVGGSLGLCRIAWGEIEEEVEDE